jgi:hypothetical protein
MSGGRTGQLSEFLWQPLTITDNASYFRGEKTWTKKQTHTQAALVLSTVV